MSGLLQLVVLAFGGGLVFFIARYLADQLITGTTTADTFLTTGIPAVIWVGIVACGIVNVIFRGRGG